MAKWSTPRILIFVAVVAQMTACPTTVWADEHYYALLFASQSEPRRPKYCHTFAAVVRATGEGPDLNTYELTVHSASWLPATGNVRVFKVRSEEGRNFGLYETIRWAQGSGQKVYQWGPAPIRAHTYWRVIRRIAGLESGYFRYRAIDTFRESRVTDCFHAISDLDPTGTRRDYPLRLTGYRVTREIARRAYENGTFLDVQGDYDWLNRRLGLDCFDICRQKAETHAPDCRSLIAQHWHATAPEIPACLPPPNIVILAE